VVNPNTSSGEISISLGDAVVSADLAMADPTRGLVVFAHGSGSSRHSRRNQAVAARVREVGLATVLLDLLTDREEVLDSHTGEFRFDIAMLGARVAEAVSWLSDQPGLGGLPAGLFGASTGAAAALVAAANDPTRRVRAVVSRGGRPDLAGAALVRVTAPTLLIVGGQDETVLKLNRQALQTMRCPRRLEIVPGATHLFPEPGALEQVASLAVDWFAEHLHC
jgi:pimeloyl-ACP methyl ester carboxylesterase